MGPRERNNQGENVVEGMEDLADPIEILYEEHERIRLHCKQLKQLAENLDAEDASDVAGSILDYMENELPLHIADEEEDLFPLLRRRFKWGSALDNELLSTLEALHDEHRDGIERGQSLLDPLRAIAAGSGPADPEMFVKSVRAFAKLQSGHAAIENEDVLPAATQRLTPDDLTKLGSQMAARRKNT